MMQVLFLLGGFLAICCMLTTKEDRAEGRGMMKPLGRVMGWIQLPIWLWVAWVLIFT